MSSNVKYITDPKDISPAVSYLDQLRTIGLDTETNGLDPWVNEVLLVQLGDEDVQYVFDTFQLDGYMTPVLNLLMNENKTKIAHNAKFDYKFLKAFYDIDIPNWVCTYVCNELLTKGVNSAKSNLDACLSKYVGFIDTDKRQQSSFVGMPWGSKFELAQVEYAAEDVQYLHQLWYKMKKLLDKRDMKQLYRLENETIRPCGELELNGIYLNKDKWLALRDDALDKAKQAKKKLDSHFIDVLPLDIFGEPVINYNSHQQLKKALGMVLKKKLDSTAKPYLKAFNHPVIDALFDYRKARKRVTTYGEKFLRDNVHPETDRVHADFKQMGTDTGRMSSRRPNMQNIPSEQIYRDPFEAQSDDYKIISADFSGQEMRLLAELSQDPNFVKAIDEGKDIHCYSASLLFEVPYEDFLVYDDEGNVVLEDDGSVKIKEEMNKKYRKPCKAISFGLMYGMGVTKLAKSLGIDLDEAKRLKQKYFNTFPKIEDLMNELEILAKKNKYALSPLDGRRRDLSSIDWDHPGKVAGALNQSKNMPFQGCGASTTKLAMCRLKHRIDEEGWDAKIVNVVHDEILYEVHKDEAEEFSGVVEEEMINAFNFYAPNVKMEVDAMVGDHWLH